MSSTTGPEEATPYVSLVGKITILLSTAIALLATPLASPAMQTISDVFADQARTEGFAQSIIAVTEAVFGETDVRFLVKFILLSVPALFIIVGAPITGWMCDKWGRKSLLNGSLILFGLAGMSTYWAETFWFMFMGRAVLGLAIAGIKTSTVAMVGDFFTGDERKQFLGWQGSATKAGGLFFMLLGGYLAEINWQTPFLGYSLSFLLLPFVIYSITESLPEKRQQRNDLGELIKAPGIPIGPAAFVFVTATMASSLFFITPVQLRFYIGDQFGLSPVYFSWAVVVGNGVGALAAIWYNKFKQAMNYSSIYALIFGAMGIGYYIMILMPNYYLSLIGLVIAGIGFGLYIPNQADWIMSFSAPERRGLAVGIVTTAMFLGQFLTAIWIVPLTVRDDPAAVWLSTSQILGVLCVIYIIFGLIEQRRGSFKPVATT